MAIIKHGIGGIFGIPEPKPLVGFPDGHVRIIARHNEFMKAAVRKNGITRYFYVIEKDGAWSPSFEILLTTTQNTPT